MWVVVTAKIDATKTRKMRMNFDNVVSYGPAEGSPTLLIGLDGQMYPVMETPEQLDYVIDRSCDSENPPLGIHWPLPLPKPPEVKLATGKSVAVNTRKRK